MCWYNKQVFNKINAFNVQCRIFFTNKNSIQFVAACERSIKEYESMESVCATISLALACSGNPFSLTGMWHIHTHTHTHSCIIIYRVVDSDLQQARCGIRRSFSDLFMVCLFWQSTVTARDAACYSELVESRSNNKIHLVYKNRNRIHILPKTLRSEEMKEKQLI